MIIFIFIIVLEIHKSFGINGIIWDKRSNSFVPIFSIKEFKLLRDKIFNESRHYEEHTFDGQEIHFVYYEEEDVFQFYDDDKKATGICGDLWTILSGYLNFTMILNRTDIRNVGTQPNPGENYTGLLGMIERKEYTILPKIEAYPTRLQVIDFTTTLWKNQHRLFIKPYYQFKTTWMLDLFSWKIWYLILVFFVLLSIISILSQRMAKEDNLQHLMSSTVDHIFYSFGALCNQGEILYTVKKNFKILSFCISIFSWFLITSFGSQLIIYMTQTILIPPFDSLETLLDDTDFMILAEEQSIVYLAFKKNYKPIYTRINKADRIQFYTSNKHMWDMACSDEDKYAVLQSEFIRMDGITTCTLAPVGEDYFRMWIVSGIAKEFTYKRSINIAIMRLQEFGIINHLKNRWLKFQSLENGKTRYYSPINVDQVSLVLGVYVFGLFTSIVIVITEQIVHMQRVKIKKLQPAKIEK